MLRFLRFVPFLAGGDKADENQPRGSRKFFSLTNMFLWRFRDFKSSWDLGEAFSDFLVCFAFGFLVVLQCLMTSQRFLRGFSRCRWLGVELPP